MTEFFPIKTEPLSNDYNITNDTNTLSYNKTKLENFTKMGYDIKEEKLDLDKIEERLPKNVDKFITEKIKKEDAGEMDEFLPEKSPSFYSASVLTLKSDDCTEVITHDEVQHQFGTQHHLTGATTQQISLPKLEIIDVHTDKDASKGPEINGNTDANFSDNKEIFIITSCREHKCELCGNSYTEATSLRRHMRRNHASSLNTEYICEICNQKFTTQAGLDRHSKTHQGPVSTQTPTEHKCEICGRYYMTSKNLLAHIRKKHPSSLDTEYICEICDQRFTTQTSLDRHSYRMHPVAEYKCELCGSYFVDVTNLRRHMRNKHPMSIDTEYICEICNHRFTSQKGLDIHSYMAHPVAPPPTEHKCEQCDNSYTTLKNLHRHLRNKHPSSITTEYMCEICNEKLTTKRGLLRHCRKMHPTETPVPSKKPKTAILQNEDEISTDEECEEEDG
ncbi:uncharacterized protein [Musca autumnalis]|uniref:uncharacterized protein n=1 Tax=Musca autumnalis TaxID=221902 RepID=UPI003CF43E0A